MDCSCSKQIINGSLEDIPVLPNPRLVPLPKPRWQRGAQLCPGHQENKQPPPHPMKHNEKDRRRPCMEPNGQRPAQPALPRQKGSQSCHPAQGWHYRQVTRVLEGGECVGKAPPRPGEAGDAKLPWRPWYLNWKPAQNRGAVALGPSARRAARQGSSMPPPSAL